MQLCSDNDALLKSIEAFDYKKKLWIVLDLMDCGYLTKVIEAHYEKFDEEFIRYILRCTACGLNFLHNRGILHRGLKPNAVLLNSDGTVKLSDFG